MDRHRDRHGATQLPRAGFRAQAAQVARGFAVAACVFLAGGCAYLAEKQAELIFRPSKDAWRGFNAGNYAFDEHWIPVGKESQKLHAWWLNGDDPDAPAVLYLHGARWNLTGSVTRIERWRQLGFAVLAVDYRGFGQSSDVAPTEEYAYEDAEAAWAYLAKIAPGRSRYIVGHSLGGAIAAELARRHPDAAGLVLEATFTSVRDMIDESPWGFLPVGLILTQNFDTLSKIGEVKVPVLVTHGTRDSIVPFEMGERLFNAANAPKRFIKVEGAGHHNLSGAGFDQYRSALAELFGMGHGKSAILSPCKASISTSWNAPATGAARAGASGC
ncbi:MAG: alpha/beta hydrolase [Usitatibacter sp.]